MMKLVILQYVVIPENLTIYQINILNYKCYFYQSFLLIDNLEVYKIEIQFLLLQI